MRIYLAVSPGDLRDAAGFQTGLAHAAYRVGEGSSLLSRNLLMQSCGSPAGRGGLLMLSDCAAPPIQRPEALAGAVLRECSRRGYSGAVLDFEAPPTEDRRRFAAVLGRRCAESRRSLYLPEAYAAAGEQRTVLINTAVSGGSLEEHLQEVCRQYGGAQNIALDLQRLQMSFSLPARNGRGEPLTQEALQVLLRQRQPAVFFSRDLCARYFTDSDNGESRFVLYDDAGTLRQKLNLGRQLGVAAAFLQWPEIRDIAAKLLRRTSARA